MIKFLKVLFQKLIKKKKRTGKSLAKKIIEAKEQGTLPDGVTVTDCGDGVYRIMAKNELSFEEITELIENFIKEDE